MVGLGRVLLEVAEDEQQAFLWRGQRALGIADVGAVLTPLALQGPFRHIVAKRGLERLDKFPKLLDRQARHRQKHCRLLCQFLVSLLTHPAPLSLADTGYHKSGFGLLNIATGSP